MNQQRFLLLLSPLLLASTLQCSKNDSTAATNSISNSLTEVSSKMTTFSNLVGGNSSSSFGKVGRAATGFGANWTTTPGVPNLGNGAEYSLKQWFIDEFDENFQNDNGAFITFGGRVKSNLDILCYLPELNIPTDSTNLPTVGTHEATLTSAVSTACGGEEIDGEYNVVITSTATTDTTYYDRLLSIEMAGSECPYRVYARLNATEINIATSEDQSCEGRDHASRTVVMINQSTGITKFMYYSKAFDTDNDGFDNSGFETYRGYLDEDADEGYVVGFYGGDNGGDSSFESGVSFVAAGKPSAGGDAALSAYTDFSGNSVQGSFQACVDPEDLTVSTDNTVDCAVEGYSAETTHSSVIQALYDATAFDTRAKVYETTEDSDVGFTDLTDIFE